MDVRSLQIFIEAAELRSFSRAGEKLGYSQPTVSFQIKQLEKELGVPLFDRIGHSVSLTDAGKDALSYAQSICQLWNEMALGSEMRKELKGVLRLGMADSLCSPIIVKHFTSFRERYPGITLHIYTGGTGELFRLLDHNEVDMVCTFDTHIYDTSYVIANEESVGVHFVASASSNLAYRGSVSIQELSTCQFLLTEKGMSYRRLLDEHLASQSLEINPVLVMGSADQICKLVEDGAGLSFLPDYVTDSAVKSGRLVRLPVAGFRISMWKQLLYRRDKWVSPQMKAMIEHISQIRLHSEE